MEESLKKLIETYETKKDEIKNRLKEFREVMDQSDERIFNELAFCLCTPQSKATICWGAVCSLVKNDLILKGNENQIRPFLNAVRFSDKKASYIIEARKFFTMNEKLEIKKKINEFKNVFDLREFLVDNVNGLGYKEASHFLRNIGLGENLAILDRHIIKNLKKYDVIEELPKTLTKRVYLDIEEKMRKFSNKINIPLDELDLLFWSEETGKIFK